MPTPLSPRQLRYVTKAVRGLARLRTRATIASAVGVGGGIAANAPIAGGGSVGPERRKLRNAFVALGAGAGATAVGAHYGSRALIKFARKRMLG